MFPNRLGDLFSRREMLKSASCGFGFLALADMLTRAATAADSGNNLLAPKAPHFTPKAKRVIFMFMAGGPSHLETFDWKPELARDGKGGPHQQIAQARTTLAERQGRRRVRDGEEAAVAVDEARAPAGVISSTQVFGRSSTPRWWSGAGIPKSRTKMSFMASS